MARKRTILRRILFIAVAPSVLLAAGAWFIYALSPEPFETRFRRSKPDLEAYAARVMATDSASPVPQPPARLGAFQTGRAERLPRGFLFFCDYGHPLDANGSHTAPSHRPRTRTVTITLSTSKATGIRSGGTEPLRRKTFWTEVTMHRRRPSKQSWRCGECDLVRSPV